MNKLVSNRALRVTAGWIAAGIVIGVAVIAGLLGAGAYYRTQQDVPAQNPIVTVLPAESSTFTPTSSPEVNAIVVTQMPTTEITQGPGPALTLEMWVEVHGTGGEGLRIRESAGLSNPINYLGLDKEVFQIIDGPINSDGFTWWKLINPYKPQVSGWAASTYIRPLADE